MERHLIFSALYDICIGLVVDQFKFMLDDSIVGLLR
jgi:hypothetical protein